jgi:hypothetical protein
VVFFTFSRQLPVIEGKIQFTSLYLTSLYPVLFAPFVYAPRTPVYFYGVGLFFVVPGTPIFPLFNAFCLYKSIFQADKFCFTTILQVHNAYLNRLCECQRFEHRNKTFFVKPSCILFVLDCHFRSVITADGKELILISHFFKLSELLVP